MQGRLTPLRLLLLLVLGLSMLSLPSVTYAWNLGAKHINALNFDTDGRVNFTLFESGTSGEEFQCSDIGPWFVIPACSDSDATCVRRRDRVASMLLAAKLAGRAIHVERSGCRVSEVALKP